MRNYRYKLTSKTKNLYKHLLTLTNLSEKQFDYKTFIRECFFSYDSDIKINNTSIPNWLEGSNISHKQMQNAIKNILGEENITDIFVDSLYYNGIDAVENKIHSLLLKLLQEEFIETTDTIKTLSNCQLFAILFYLSCYTLINYEETPLYFGFPNRLSDFSKSLDNCLQKNKIINLSASFGAGKTSLIKIYIDNTDNRIIYVKYFDSCNNIFDCISFELKLFWETIDTTIYNILNHENIYLEKFKNSIIFIDELAIAKAASFISDAQENNLQVVLITNIQINIQGIAPLDITLSKDDIQEILSLYCKINISELKENTNNLSKLIDIAGYDLNVYRIIFDAYSIYNKKDSSIAQLFITSLLDGTIYNNDNRLKLIYNHTEKHFIAHLCDYYFSFITYRFRKALLLLSKLNDLSLPYNYICNEFGINFAILALMAEHNLCHINNGYVIFHINTLIVSTLNKKQTWDDNDVNIFIHFTNLLKNQILKITQNPLPSEILILILDRWMTTLSNGSEHFNLKNLNKSQTKKELANFYVLCIWYMALHGNTDYANRLYENITFKSSDISIYLLEHTKNLLNLILYKKFSNHHTILNEKFVKNLASQKSTFYLLDIFFIIQECITWLENYLFDFLIKNNSEHITVTECHSLLSILFTLSEELKNISETSYYYIAILYCDLYKFYYETVTTQSNVEQTRYDNYKQDIHTAYEMNTYYSLVCSFKKHMIKLFSGMNGNSLTCEQIDQEISKITNLHSDYQSWTQYDNFFYYHMISVILKQLEEKYSDKVMFNKRYANLFLEIGEYLNTHIPIFLKSSYNHELMNNYILSHI